LSGPQAVDRVLDALMAKEWVVYSKPCLAKTETVVDYLGVVSHPDLRATGLFLEDTPTGESFLRWSRVRESSGRIAQ
jgi:hypothetical protein